MGESDEVVSEVWTAQHPTRGAIKLTIATPEHLRTIDAGWPEIITDDKDEDGKDRDKDKGGSRCVDKGGSRASNKTKTPQRLRKKRSGGIK